MILFYLIEPQLAGAWGHLGPLGGVLVRDKCHRPSKMTWRRLGDWDGSGRSPKSSQLGCDLADVHIS